MLSLKQLAFLLLILFGLAACQNEIKEAMQGEGRGLLPSQTTYNAAITYSSGGKITTRLFAPLMERYVTKDSTWLVMKKGFNTIFYDSTGTFQSKLKSDYGIWYERSRYILARGNVQFENVKQEILSTSELIWRQDSARIYTDKAIKIVRTDGVIYGMGLEAAEDFSQYSIKKITGELYVKEDSTQTDTASYEQ